MAKGKKVKVAEVTEEKDVAEVTPGEVKVETPEEETSVEPTVEPEAPVETLEEEVKPEEEVKTEEIKPEADATTTPKEEEENLLDEQVEKEIKKVEEEMNVIGHVRSRVFQKSSFIKTKSLKAPVCLSALPDDLRKYLVNKWWWPNVYEKGEEWLLKHKADMEKIEKLKKFLSDHYL